MLSRITVRDFRCIEHADLGLRAPLTFLVGKNAQGKTSLLEAICVLMRLQSPRTSSRAEWMRFGAGSCLVEGRWHDTSLRYAQTAHARRLAVNGVVCARSADYFRSTALIVWMDHSDMNLARGGAEHRRRLLDFAAAQLFPEHLPALRHYERALRARNFLLKRDAVIQWRQVDAYGESLAEHARVIRAGRAELVRRMREWIAASHTALSGGAEVAAVDYACGYSGEDLREELLAMRGEETRARVTAAGTHRDDLLILINGRGAAAFGSEGQQRSVCLALKLAQARVLQEAKGEPPLLLLDDVFGELDAGRRRALLEQLPAGTQAVVTATSADWVGKIPDADFFSVEAGSFQPK
jgi:DNA replication and repair protein RecF